MKRFSLTLLFIILSLSCFAAKGFDIRKIRWGMSKGQIKKTENGVLLPISSKQFKWTKKHFDSIYNGNFTFLIYKTRAAGCQAHAVYLFTKNKLVKVILKISVDIPEWEIFDKYLTSFLDKKYGKHIKTAIFWEERVRDVKIWANKKTRIEYYKRVLRYSKLNIRIRGL